MRSALRRRAQRTQHRPRRFNPPFETAISPSFNAAVDSDVSKTTVTITPRDPNAQIEPHYPNDVPLYDDDPAADGWQVKLRSYRTTFQWSVRSAHGGTTNFYSLVVFRDRSRQRWRAWRQRRRSRGSRWSSW